MATGTSRSFVIGDIHGCVEELDRLLDHLIPAAGDKLVFLGDYIDRGPSSREVIARLLQLTKQGPQCTFLKGNHEDMFLAFLGLPGHYGDSFLYNGGDTTLSSYGVERFPGHEVARRLPADHLVFLQGLELRHTLGDFLCVHAGINPGRPLEAQEPEDLLWIRGAFIHNPHPFGVTVVFGHTPCRDVLVDLPYKIGLDTGLVYGNKLSCLEISEGRLFQIRRGTPTVTCRSLSLRPGSSR
jgi:serine/threonine protein phosphatase 1